MRDIFLTGSDGSSSLPKVISLYQYYSISDRNNIIYGYNRTNKNLVDNAVGSMGDSFFDFSFDCIHEAVTNEDPFEKINKVLNDSPGPVINKESIRKDYYILECPDYSAQAMTPYYRDFIPQIWYDGRKIWQKYIGVLKYYPKKVAYILIAKTNNIKDYIDNSIDYSKFKIRIVFKNNIEDIYSSKDFSKLTGAINLKLSTPSNIPENEYIFNLSKNDINLISSDLHDTYELYIKVNNSWERVINSRVFYNLELIKLNTESNNNGEKEEAVSRQTKKDNDYYKQTFVRDYIYKEKDIEYNRTIKYQLKLGLNVAIDGTLTEIYLLPKSNVYDVMYLRGIDDESTRLSTFVGDVRDKVPFSVPEDIMVFNSHGLKVRDLHSLESGMQYEVVPEYSNRRKFEWYFAEDSEHAGKNKVDWTEVSNGRYAAYMLKSSSIYPWNIKYTGSTEKHDIIGFDKDGYFYNPDVESDGYSGVFDLIVYWNEEDHKEEYSEITGGDLSEALVEFSYQEGLFYKFSSTSTNYYTLTDEYLLTTSLNDNTVNKETSIYPYNGSNTEMAAILDADEPQFTTDGTYIYLNGTHPDYSDLISCLTELEKSEIYTIQKSAKESEIDTQYRNLTDNIVTMYLKNPETRIVGFYTKIEDNALTGQQFLVNISHKTNSVENGYFKEGYILYLATARESVTDIYLYLLVKTIGNTVFDIKRVMSLPVVVKDNKKYALLFIDEELNDADDVYLYSPDTEIKSVIKLSY